MKDVCVITGGGSGMGLETAKIMGKDHFIIICGRNEKKLETAVDELKTMGIEAEFIKCDVSNKSSVLELADYASKNGKVRAVIHSAGMSPHMGDGKKIMEVNALGTINVNNAFYKVMEKEGCIIDVSSMSAYLTPKIIMPKRIYKYSKIDPEIFLKKIMKRVNLFPKKVRPGLSYAISKDFVIWFAKKDAARFGEKGIRVISVSPGSFDTPMGDIEKDDAQVFVEFGAIKRFGHAEEIGELFAFCASKKAGYLTGTDILCDGGVVASGVNPTKIKNKKEDKNV